MILINDQVVCRPADDFPESGGEALFILFVV
jgi:hypothetical protein